MVGDVYHTIAAPAAGEYKDRGSKFLAYAFPVTEEAEWQARLEEVRKQHPKARHHCFAFRLGVDGNQYRANDDGEPAGSAGRPILGQIDSFGLTDVIVIVARYFGGTLLGVPGLIAAYKGSAQDALQQAGILEKTLQTAYRITLDYALAGSAMSAVKKLEFELLSQSYDDRTATLEIGIRRSEAAKKILEFKALAAGLHIEEVAGMEQIPGMEVTCLHAR